MESIAGGDGANDEQETFSGDRQHVQMALRDPLQPLSIAFNRRAAALFRALGGLIARRPLWFVVAGVISAAVLSAGLYNASELTAVEELWTEKGSRLQSERSFYDKYFGGIGRNAAVIFQARGPNGIGDPTVLDQMRESAAVGSWRLAFPPCGTVRVLWGPPPCGGVGEPCCPRGSG